MSVAVLSSKGQLVIPADMRRAADLNVGDRIVIDFDQAAGELRLRKAESTRQVIEALSSRVEGWIKTGTAPVDDPRAYYLEHRGAE